MGFLAYRRLDRGLKILLSYFVIAALSDGLVLFLSFENIHNIWLFNVFILIDYGFLAFAFSYWQKSLTMERLLRLSIPVFVLVWLGAKVFHVESFDQMNSFSRSLESLLLIAISLSILSELHEESNFQARRSARFWIGTGVLIYFAGNLIIFATSETGTSLALLWWIHATISIVANLCFAAGFLYSPVTYCRG
jgi:hypothetical protein